MLKNVLSILLIPLMFLLLIILPYSANAQEPTPADVDSPYEIAFKDYQTQIVEYQAAHQEYVVRRSQYLRFKTLQSQQDCRDATAKMMQERDDVVLSYIKALKERLNEASGVNDISKTALNTKIDAEYGWFTDHKSKIPTAGSLEDLLKDNTKAKERFTKAQPLFSEILSVVSSGKITDFDERLKDVFGQLKTKIDEIKVEERDEYKLTDTQIQNLDRWVFNSDNLILRSEDRQAEADTLISTYVGQTNKAASIYSSVLMKLSESQQFLKEAGSYLIEIVREIKTKSS